jgi:hypothetical protein
VFLNADFCGKISIIDVPKHNMDVTFEPVQFSNHEWSTIIPTVNHGFDIVRLKVSDGEVKVINTIMAIADNPYLHVFLLFSHLRTSPI